MEEEQFKHQFKPNINEISNWIVDQKYSNENKDVFKRLIKNKEE